LLHVSYKLTNSTLNNRYVTHYNDSTDIMAHVSLRIFCRVAIFFLWMMISRMAACCLKLWHALPLTDVCFTLLPDDYTIANSLCMVEMLSCMRHTSGSNHTTTNNYYKDINDSSPPSHHMMHDVRPWREELCNFVTTSVLNYLIIVTITSKPVSSTLLEYYRNSS
jgi:hypothetical protein